MRLRAPELEIPADTPFANDVLERNQSAESILQLIKGTEDPIVICLNAPWGQGKSTFLRMFRQTCKNNKIQSILLNAWENDFSNDAFVTLLGDIELGLDGLAATAKERGVIERKFDKAKKIGTQIVKATLPLAVRVATSGIVRLEDVSEQAISDFTGKLAEERIRQHEDARKSVTAFRAKLSDLAETASGSGGGDTKNPLVIFVDELDRCKPPYAVSYLENIKHFFSVPNVVFIIALDKDQLAHSIRSLYGGGMDVDGYLRRFIDVDLNLPIPSIGNFIESLIGKFGLNEFFNERTSPTFQYDKTQVVTALTQLAQAFHLTLRELERACATISLASSSTPSDYRFYPLLLVTLVVFKIKHPQTYLDFVSGKIDHIPLLEKLKESKPGQELLASNYGAAIEAHLVSCRSGRHLDRELSQLYLDAASQQTENTAEKSRLERISRILSDWDFRESFGTLGYVTQKIDLLVPQERS